MLKQMLDTNPKLKSFIDATLENKSPELREIVSDAIKDKLKEARTEGIYIGWYSFMITAVKKLKGAKSLEQAIEEFTSEAEKAKAKLNLPDKATVTVDMNNDEE